MVSQCLDATELIFLTYNKITNVDSCIPSNSYSRVEKLSHFLKLSRLLFHYQIYFSYSSDEIFEKLHEQNKEKKYQQIVPNAINCKTRVIFLFQWIHSFLNLFPQSHLKSQGLFKRTYLRMEVGSDGNDMLGLKQETYSQQLITNLRNIWR